MVAQRELSAAATCGDCSPTRLDENPTASQKALTSSDPVNKVYLPTFNISPQHVLQRFILTLLLCEANDDHLFIEDPFS